MNRTTAYMAAMCCHPRGAPLSLSLSRGGLSLSRSLSHAPEGVSLSVYMSLARLSLCLSIEGGCRLLDWVLQMNLLLLLLYYSQA